MKRSPSLLLTILLFASIGAFAAGVKLFPDIASDMPLIPRGSGTLTDTLLSIIGKSNPNEIATSSGLVKNTQKLGGFSGSQYIRIDSACTDPLKPVWIGVNASGKPICGSKSSPGLVYLGTISEVGQTVSIYQSSGAIVTATVGMKVYNGDTIDTSTTGKATVLFNDRSLLRLSANTTVTLDVGQYTGTSIASIILGRGDLWGRVLADNGQYDVGTSDIVAAVRGTSFALQKNNVSPPKPQYLSGAWNLNLSSGDPATFTLVDSVNPTNAVEIECLTSGTPNRVASLDTTQSSNVITGCNTQSSVKKTPAQLYGDSPWIRENTRADILYMFAIPDKTVKITNELASTEPTESEKAPLCLLYNGVDNGVWYEPEKRCVYAYADYTTGKDEMTKAGNPSSPNLVLLDSRTDVWLRDDGNFIGKGCCPNGTICTENEGEPRPRKPYLTSVGFSNPLNRNNANYSILVDSTTVPGDVSKPPSSEINPIWNLLASSQEIRVSPVVKKCIDNDNPLTPFTIGKSGYDFFQYAKVDFYGYPEGTNSSTQTVSRMKGFNGWKYDAKLRQWKLEVSKGIFSTDPSAKQFKVFWKEPGQTPGYGYFSLDGSAVQPSSLSPTPRVALNVTGESVVGSAGELSDRALSCLEVIGRRTGVNSEGYCSNDANWTKMVTPDVGVGILITGGQYLEYAPSELGNLAGKTMQVKLKDPIPQSNPTSLYLADFGTYGIYFLGGQLYKRSFIPPTTTTSITFTSPVYTFTIDTGINSVVLGNRLMTGVLNLLQFINNTIQSVVIY